MDLNEIRVFVKVVQAGSFTRAARQLALPNSTVSARVSALEKRLGVTLLQRTTRRLHVTEAGQAYFRRCLIGLAEIERGETEVTARQAEAQGTLRVTAPVDLGSHCMLEILEGYARRCPRVRVELAFSDEVVDLVGEGFDVGIRSGELRDSSGLAAKRAGISSWVPYASPAYLKRAGTPAHPKDLRGHACLPFVPFGSEHWQLTHAKNGAEVSVAIRSQIVGNDLNLIRALASAGRGIALLPAFTCRGETESHQLVRILPEWSAGREPVQLVYPRSRFGSPKTREFIDVAVAVLGSKL